MGNHSTTHFQIPSIRESHDLGFDPHPTKVKAWIEKLPLADVGRSARMIYHALVTMNRTLIAMQHRSQILELFREPAHDITETLKKYYIGQAFPLAEKNYKAAMLARELHSEMANGYKIVLSSLLTNQTSVFTAGKSLIPLHRAMHYLTELLITSYQTYTPCPATTWHDIHQLHQHAELKMLDQSPIHDGSLKMPPHHNIGNLYKKTLLLSIAGPYHLSQDEISTTFSALDQWAAHSTLTPVLNADDPTAAYIINQDNDEPTAFLTANRLRHDKTRVLRGCLALDTTALVAHLHSLANHTPAEARLAEATLPAALIRRLISAWSMTSKRNLSRIQKNTTLIIGLGLKTAHHITANNLDPHKVRPHTPPTHVAQFVSREIGSAAAVAPAHKTWNKSRHNAHAKTTSDMTKDADIEKSLEGMSVYATHHCKVANESAGGACLSWTGMLTTALRIGEIIVVHGGTLEGDANDWALATIRWMKNTTPSTLEFGIQMLTPTSEAVQIRHADNGTHEFSIALLLPELKVINQTATLIVPAQLFTPGDKVQVKINNCTQHFILHELVEDTGIFNQFRFSLTPNISEPTASASTEVKQKEFESLWATI